MGLSRSTVDLQKWLFHTSNVEEEGERVVKVAHAVVSIKNMWRSLCHTIDDDQDTYPLQMVGGE